MEFEFFVQERDRRTWYNVERNLLLQAEHAYENNGKGYDENELRRMIIGGWDSRGDAGAGKELCGAQVRS